MGRVLYVYMYTYGKHISYLFIWCIFINLCRALTNNNIGSCTCTFDPFRCVVFSREFQIEKKMRLTFWNEKFKLYKRNVFAFVFFLHDYYKLVVEQTLGRVDPLSKLAPILHWKFLSLSLKNKRRAGDLFRCTTTGTKQATNTNEISMLCAVLVCIYSITSPRALRSCFSPVI